MEFQEFPKSVIVGALLAIVGLLVLVFAYLQEWGALTMILGAIVLIVGAVVIYARPLEQLGGSSDPKPKTKVGVSPAKDYGETQLGKALTFAEQKLNEKEAELPSSVVEFYRGKIEIGSQALGKDEETALISMSQVIGSIINA